MGTYCDADIEAGYRDMLDDVYGVVNICGIAVSASVALERVDPVAYRIGLTEYADTISDD